MLGQIDLGVSIFQAMPLAPVDARIDDLAVDMSRIGCNGSTCRGTIDE